MSGDRSADDPARSGRLVVVATPIGNLGDLSPRAVEALASADTICCEDSRRTRALLSHAGVRTPPLVVVHRHNEEDRVPVVVDRLARGETVALVSDAGMPVVSDPGALIVAAAIDHGYPVTVVPGPTAALAALVVSGLPAARFCVEGFLPRRGPERARRLDAIAGDERTAVVFEAPHRLVATLRDLADRCGPERRVVVARELTKLHEEVWRGSLGAAATVFEERQGGEGVRGEVVLVVAGRPTVAATVSDAAVAAAVAAHRRAGASARDAAMAVVQELAVPHRRAYQAAVAWRRDQDGRD